MFFLFLFGFCWLFVLLVLGGGLFVEFVSKGLFYYFKKGFDDVCTGVLDVSNIAVVFLKVF